VVHFTLTAISNRPIKTFFLNLYIWPYSDTQIYFLHECSGHQSKEKIIQFHSTDLINTNLKCCIKGGSNEGDVWSFVKINKMGEGRSRECSRVL